MTLKSMTGFARADGARGATSWGWEVKSVNGRGLDLRMRLPPGYEALEPKVREMVGQCVTRGSVNVGLVVKRADGVSEIRLNEAALKQVVAAAARVQAITGASAPTTEGLLNQRGVLEFVETSESDEEAEARTAAMLAGLKTALAQLVESRAAEGRHLAQIMRDQLADVERLVGLVAASPARSTDAIRRRLEEAVARIVDTSTALDPVRLHQEAALLAARADVEEELKRLTAHVAGARDLLKAKEPVGRKLDFLAQEFNREANTLCSKSNDPDITRAGLDLKATIDQMREQVQNVE
jgi:uncharacterized protein (TIGR00255 family)